MNDIVPNNVRSPQMFRCIHCNESTLHTIYVREAMLACCRYCFRVSDFKLDENGAVVLIKGETS